MDNGSGVEINDGSKPLTRFEICQFQCQIANFTENRVWPALNCRWWSKSDQNSSEWRLKRHKLHLTVRTQPQMANGIIWASGMISIFSNFSSYCIEKFGNPFVCIFSPEPSSRSIQWYLTMRLNLICRIFFSRSILPVYLLNSNRVLIIFIWHSVGIFSLFIQRYDVLLVAEDVVGDDLLGAGGE